MSSDRDEFRFLKIGEVRPSQMTHTYGIGAIVELPFLSVVTRSHEDWKERDSDGADTMRTIAEPRLLEAVQHDLGRSVEALRTPPVVASSNRRDPARDKANWVGAWGWPFPRWLRCMRCDMLTTIDQGMFKFPKVDPRRPHEAGFLHEGCGGYNVRATPVRVVTACKAGHLDDFPWVEFAHRQTEYVCRGDGPNLTLSDRGYAERATDLTVECVACDHPPVSVDLAFGMHAAKQMPTCRGFHPHLQQFDPNGCDRTAEALMVGASNLWFPLKRSVLSIPGPLDEATQFVGKHWGRLRKVPDFGALSDMANPEHYAFFPDLAAEDIALEDVWTVVEQRKQDQSDDDQPTAQPDLLLPEWQTFTTKDSADNRNFRMVNAGEPATVHQSRFGESRQLTRLREVVALTGFTRLESIDADDLEHMTSVQRAPLSRIRSSGKAQPSWVPVAESLGEGILVGVDELAVADWEADATNHPRLEGLRDAHRTWRASRDLDPNGRLPRARFVLLHTLSHVLINELALEAGYNTASIRERIYARHPDHEAGPMAGIMLYTSEPDAEGTLGGLVALGDPDRLGATIDAALRRAQLCSSDPFCSEHEATAQEGAMHGAACHACVFLPETSCDSANRYLDRSFVVPTLSCDDGLALFPWTT